MLCSSRLTELPTLGAVFWSSNCLIHAVQRKSFTILLKKVSDDLLTNQGAFEFGEDAHMGVMIRGERVYTVDHNASV